MLVLSDLEREGRKVVDMLEAEVGHTVVPEGTIEEVADGHSVDTDFGIVADMVADAVVVDLDTDTAAGVAQDTVEGIDESIEVGIEVGIEAGTAVMVENIAVDTHYTGSLERTVQTWASKTARRMRVLDDEQGRRSDSG